ncbi:DUF559 domain-containing protein [Egibacter rhizosphaerae]|uniref:DUF559 domain-containing protein n=1 Tax=Egibacter rhizosphaerae TaxID=1670831 RepID=A0A411YG48_9ACTN|nr:DUF559 domain-containing protein [Egibacter rhizosphaerae]QBI20166.1 DUF559 domain-containing protein [Egibacter rhizosphaerae]
MDEQLAEAYRRMAANHGLIERSEAVSLLGAKRVDGLLRRGRWGVVHRGVYRAAGSARPAEQIHLAAVWRVGYEAVLTGEPGLGLFGVEANRSDAVPDVIGRRGQRVRAAPFRVRYVGPLHPRDRATLNRIPIARPHRMLVDRAAELRGRELRTVIDSARRLGLTGEDRLHDAAMRARPQRGAAVVLRLLESGGLATESEGERLLADLFSDVDPPPEPQQFLLPDIRVDLVWRDAGLVVEYDGTDHHTLRSDRDYDRQRRDRLRAAGWTVIVVTKQMCRDLDGLRRRVLARRAELLRERTAIADA